MADDIFTASEKGEAARIRRFLDENPAMVQSFNSDGWTALHLAAHYGHLEAADVLLSYGADSNMRSKNSLNNLPLHAAVAGNRTDMVQLLVADGSDINSRQHGGWTALHGAAANGNLAMVQFLIRNGAEIGARNEDGLTPLDMANEKGHDEIAKLLKAQTAV
jgi:ankyrin repeat protein